LLSGNSFATNWNPMIITKAFANVLTGACDYSNICTHNRNNYDYVCKNNYFYISFRTTKPMNILEQFGIIPIDFATLASVFEGYKSPADKVASLEKKGELIRLKKGLFVVSPQVHRQALSVELIANHLYGPSYISFEKALSLYKLIPERVHTTRSMTIKRARNFTNPIGNFEYVTATTDYYRIGIRTKVIDSKLAYLIASPEKALCDMIITSKRLRLQSVKAMQTYLEEDLRIDVSAIEVFDADVVKRCIETGKKRTELLQLYKLLN